MNMADLKIYYSGGAGNEDPNASLGGVISSAAGKRVLSQGASAPTNITGVVIDYACGNTLGNGTLTFTYVDGTADYITWTPNGGVEGPQIVIGAADGRYVIPDDSGEEQLHVTVTEVSLPGSSQTDADITITNLANETYDDISKAEAFAGDVEYRCFYLKNDHATDTMYGVGIYLKSDAVGADSLKLAADFAGVGNGVSTGVADTVATEGDAPAPALTFTAPATQGAGIVLGDLAAGEVAAFWVERTVPALTTVSTPLDISEVGLFAYI